MREGMRRSHNFADQYPQMYPGKRAQNVTFIVTRGCTLRCSYCYEHDKDGTAMTLDVGKRCIDLLFRCDAGNNKYLNAETADAVILDFIGGEPLLEMTLVAELVDYFRMEAVKRGHRWATQYMICFSTNGTEYFSPTVQRFMAANDGMVSMSVTVDGDQETHDRCRVDCSGCGSYARAAAAFADVSARYGQDHTKFTISPENVDRVYMACRDLVERFHLSRMHCNCAYEEGWNENLAGIFYDQLKQLADWAIDTGQTAEFTIFDPWIGHVLPPEETQNWCGGTGRMLAFDVDGTIYPCLRYAPMAITNRSPLRIGDVEHGIGVLPEDEKTVDTLNAITRQSQSTEECINCPIASGCGWCSAYSYEKVGTPNQRMTYICPMHKARVLATSYYHNRIHRLRGEAERFPLNVPAAWAVPIIGTDEYKMLSGLAAVEE